MAETTNKLMTNADMTVLLAMIEVQQKEKLKLDGGKAGVVVRSKRDESPPVSVHVQNFHSFASVSLVETSHFNRAFALAHFPSLRSRERTITSSRML